MMRCRRTGGRAPHGSGAAVPGRGPTAHSTRVRSRSGSRQVSICARVSAAIRRTRSASEPCAACSSIMLSTVYESPGRSISMALISKRGSAAMATSVIASRSAAALMGRPRLCGGWAAGMKSTESRCSTSAASVASQRWPTWGGSKVPPRTPRRRRSLTPRPIRARQCRCARWCRPPRRGDGALRQCPCARAAARSAPGTPRC